MEIFSSQPTVQQYFDRALVLRKSRVETEKSHLYRLLVKDSYTTVIHIYRLFFMNAKPFGWKNDISPCQKISMSLRNDKSLADYWHYIVRFVIIIQVNLK